MIPALRQAFTDAELRGVPLAVLGWLAAEVLDVQDYRRVKIALVEAAMRCGKATAVDALALLTTRGYLQRRDSIDGPEYRLRWTRDGRYTDHPDRAAPPSAA